MVEVFKTNVLEKNVSKQLVKQLQQHFPTSRINFDLEDCDKILRIEEKVIPETICTKKIIELMKTNGYSCEILD